MYWNLSLGANYFKPQSNIRDYYADRGDDLDPEILPFAQLGLGWQACRIRLAKERYPLVLKTYYTFADDFDFPSDLPDGAEGITVHGPTVTVGLQLRF